MYEILSNREIIKIIGLDSIKFLQNLVTNDICKSRYCYTYLLNNQGRYLFDFFVYVHSPEEIYLDIDKSNKAALIDHFNFYKFRSKIQIIDCSDEYKVIYSLQKLDIDTLVTSHDPRYSILGFRSTVSSRGLTTGSRNTVKQYWIPWSSHVMTAKELTYPLCHSRESGNPRRSYEMKSNYTKFNLEKSKEFVSRGAERILIREHPRSYKDDIANFSSSTSMYLEDKYNFTIIDGVEDLITDKSIPNMYGAEELNAISFDKGCYVGQEVISRAKYQGVIRKKIYKITVDEDLSLLVKDEEILADNDKIGVICSSYRNKAIALIREEKYLANKEADITVKGIKINLSLAPWY